MWFETGPFMKMILNSRARAALVGLFFWVLLNSSSSYSLESDINCLRAIKASLRDPFNYLNYSWDFNNHTEGHICKFIGIECWHPDEDKVLSIDLSDMELEGEFPRGIQNCSSLTGLDLSRNKLHGNIPSDIDTLAYYVTQLDLSSNSFSGEIPVGLANCSLLNVLKLGNNQLTGQIPLQIGQLGRIKNFSVANNQLIGPIPQFVNRISANSYANNTGLCGDPLPPCQSTKKKTRTSAGVIVGAAVTGVTISAVLVFACCLVYVEHQERKR